MAMFKYKALGSNSSTKTGVLEAENARDARNKLRAQGVHVTDIQEIEGDVNQTSIFSGFFKKRDLTVVSTMTRQLATLLESGIPLRDAIAALVEQVEDPTLKAALKDIKEQITSGKTFAVALGSHPFFFDNLYVNMVAAGESAGNLEIVLKQISEFLRAQNRIHGKVSSALTYPMITIVVSVAVVAFLMTVVVPKLQAILLSQNKELPITTKILMFCSNFCSQWWPLIVVAVIAGFIGFKYMLRTKSGKRYYDQLMITIPILGILFKKQMISRFATTLSALLQSGISIVEALRISMKVMDNVVMVDTLKEAERSIVEGIDIATPFRKSKTFPPMLGYMISVGEKSGQLPAVLAKVAQSYDEEIDITIEKVISLLNPAIMCILACIVGFIVVAIIQPMMSMSKI